MKLPIYPFHTHGLEMPHWYFLPESTVFENLWVGLSNVISCLCRSFTHYTSSWDSPHLRTCDQDYTTSPAHTTTHRFVTGSYQLLTHALTQKTSYAGIYDVGGTGVNGVWLGGTRGSWECVGMTVGVAELAIPAGGRVMNGVDME